MSIASHFNLFRKFFDLGMSDYRGVKNRGFGGF